MSLLVEIVFIASQPRDFYIEKVSPILMTQVTWKSHTVTPTQSLRKPKTDSSFSGW